MSYISIIAYYKYYTTIKRRRRYISSSESNGRPEIEIEVVSGENVTNSDNSSGNTSNSEEKALRKSCIRYG